MKKKEHLRRRKKNKDKKKKTREKKMSEDQQTNKQTNQRYWMQGKQVTRKLEEWKRHKDVKKWKRNEVI